MSQPHSSKKLRLSLFLEIVNEARILYSVKIVILIFPGSIRNPVFFTSTFTDFLLYSLISLHGSSFVHGICLMGILL